MNFKKEAAKLLTNKYFLYFMVFLSATNVLGYLVTNKFNAIGFFVLIGLITYHFSKNMAVVLLISLVTTNFLIANNKIREGLENATDDKDVNVEVSSVVEKAVEVNPELEDTINAVKSSTNNDEVKQKLEDKADKLKSKGLGDKIKSVVETDASSNEVKPKEASTENFGKSRLDYAATIEESYANLDNLLGSDSIKQLSTDTQKLMQQQQNLFNTMNQMVPVLEGAKNMLKGFDIGGLTKSLNGIEKMNVK